jgi:Domain of unknown function (DUF4926)
MEIEYMNCTIYSDVILLRDLPEDGLSIGDIGVVVEKHEVPGMETGYSVEFFDIMSHFRLPSGTDRPTVRLLAKVG